MNLATKNKRKELLNFIDKNAFDPILKAKPNKLSEEDKGKLEDIQRKTVKKRNSFTTNIKPQKM